MVFGQLKPGWDLWIFWNIGRTIWSGQSPYAAFESYYPPATNFLFAIFGLIPPITLFVVWAVINVSVLYLIARRTTLAWLFYLPASLMIYVGNLDMALMGLGLLLGRGAWTAAAAGALITIKPQVALIILPFWLWKWAQHDRPRLIKWAGITSALHILPALFRPTIYSEWIARMSIQTGMRLAISPGLWSLSVHGVPIAMLAALAGLVLLAGLLSGNENLTRNAASLAAYGAMPWDQSLLVGTAPAYLMIPASWLAWALELRLHTAVPFMIIPIAAIIWNALDPRLANVAQSYGATYN